MLKILNGVDAYPQFRELVPQDSELINNFVAELPPFSDYIFSNLLDWRLEDKPTEISQLNNNLVIKMADNYGKKIVTTFIGYDHYSDTINILLKSEPKIYHVPEFIVQKVQDSIEGFRIEEDRNSFDYIFSVRNMLDIDNPELRTKRKEINTFFKKNPNVETRLLDLAEANTQKQIINLYERWMNLKDLKSYKKACECEFSGLKRFLSHNKLFKYFSLGILIKGELVGYTINEIVNPDYLLSAYTKVDLSYRGLSSFLTYRTSEYAKSKGISYINHEPDLGIDGLRVNKMGWRPVNFLKKYKIVKNKI